MRRRIIVAAMILIAFASATSSAEASIFSNIIDAINPVNAIAKTFTGFIDGIGGSIFGENFDLGGITKGFLNVMGDSAKDILGGVGNIILVVLKSLGQFIEAVSDYLFSFAFGDLMLLIDYRQVPKAGAYVNSLLKVTTNLGMILAGFFFILSSGFNAVRLVGGKTSWREVFLYVSRLLGAMLLIVTLPYLFTTSLAIVGAISNEIISVKVPGQTNIHAPTGKLANAGAVKPLSGLDLIESSIDYVVNLPETVIEEGKKAVSETIEEAKSQVETTLGKAIGETVDNTVKEGLNQIVPQFAGAYKTNKENVFMDLTAKQIFTGASYILKTIISLTSIGLLITLLTLKGFQLVALLMLFILAPIAFAFMVLPAKENLGLKALKTIWSIMAWNIIWAVGIKVFHIINLIIDAFNTSGNSSFIASGLNDVLPFAGVFMKIGVLVVMDGVSGWVGIIAIAAIGTAVGSLGAQMIALPAMMRGVSGGLRGTSGAIKSLMGETGKQPPTNKRGGAKPAPNSGKGTDGVATAAGMAGGPVLAATVAGAQAVKKVGTEVVKSLNQGRNAASANQSKMADMPKQMMPKTPPGKPA